MPIYSSKATPAFPHQTMISTMHNKFPHLSPKHSRHNNSRANINQQTPIKIRKVGLARRLVPCVVMDKFDREPTHSMTVTSCSSAMYHIVLLKTNCAIYLANLDALLIWEFTQNQRQKIHHRDHYPITDLSHLRISNLCRIAWMLRWVEFTFSSDP